MSFLPRSFVVCKKFSNVAHFCSTTTGGPHTEINSNFHHAFIQNHRQTTLFQKLLLSVGSASVSLLDPSRGDMIAVLGETTGPIALERMLQKMQSSSEGQQILREQPRINSSTVDLQSLSTLPKGTVGRVYIDFLQKNKVTPDSRPAVQFVDDEQLAYVMQRYREVHDLIHAILRMPTNMLGEVTVKWVEALQFGLPMCVGGGLFGAVRLKPKQRLAYVTQNLPWAIKTGLTSHFLLNVYFEQRWEQKLDDLLKELNIQPLKIETPSAAPKN